MFQVSVQQINEKMIWEGSTFKQKHDTNNYGKFKGMK